MYICVYTFIRRCIETETYLHTHTRARARTHTHTHTQAGCCRTGKAEHEAEAVTEAKDKAQQHTRQAGRRWLADMQQICGGLQMSGCRGREGRRNKRHLPRLQMVLTSPQSAPRLLSFLISFLLPFFVSYSKCHHITGFTSHLSCGKSRSLV